MKRRDIPHEPRHAGVLSGASQMISHSMVRSTQTVHLSCVKISTISKRTELSLERRHLGGPSGTSKTIYKSMICLVQTVHLSCNDTKTVSKWKEVRFHMPKSPRRSIKYIQNDFQAYGTFDANHPPILRQD
jgi:hypothetical protein